MNQDEGARQEIVRNAVRCRRCNTVVESEHNRDFRRCPCGAVAVDGGHVSLSRVGHAEDFEERTIVNRP